ncbi:MAG: hydrogenase maturation protease [Anaerolineae bacterium]|nr:hydrogenase maturation protease [Anaerolineae bacterium]
MYDYDDRDGDGDAAHRIPTLVLALGNPLRGDDGVGAAVLEQLEQAGRPPSVTLTDGGTAGLETVLLLQGYPRAIIIDAAEMGLAPGAWRRFTLQEVELRAADPHLRGTIHGAGLAEALALGEALGILPADLVIYGVQPAVVGWTPGLSEPVQAIIPTLCAAILDNIQKG